MWSAKFCPPAIQSCEEGQGRMGSGDKSYGRQEIEADYFPKVTVIISLIPVALLQCDLAIPHHGGQA